ncbi:MAG: MoxR family ATPase [Chitinophagaceae bacterium]|nr:MoxR family ATPase [Chitinophagaceae bacterium]
MEETNITPENQDWKTDQTAQQKISDAVISIRSEIGKVIVGQDDLVTLLITGLFAGGHLLIEGVPGIAKTLIAKLLAKTLSIKFSRIQFTPDLMPSDVTGTSVFNFKNSEFTFNRGPVFSNIVLIDEINRSPAKTQAALFEVMEEQQITVDGITYKMEFPFIVLATQNPIEQEGTYKLPEAQLDRFLFRVKINYPSLEEEKKIIHLFKEDFSNRKSLEVQPVFSAADIAACRRLTEQVHIKDELVAYIAQIVYQTRNHGDLFLGASPRASLAILRSSKALAAIKGRDFVTPDDIQFVSYPVLNHRIILTPEREMEGMEVEDVIREIIRKIEVPR